VSSDVDVRIPLEGGPHSTFSALLQGKISVDHDNIFPATSSFSAKATIWFCDQAACSYHVDVEVAEAALYFRDMQCQKRWRRSARTFMIVGDAIIRSVGTRAKRKRRVIAHLKGSSIRILADAQALPWLNKTDSRAPIKLRCVELQSGPRSREAHGPLYCK
jgi:hypothetical protein